MLAHCLGPSSLTCGYDNGGLFIMECFNCSIQYKDWKHLFVLSLNDGMNSAVDLDMFSLRDGGACIR